MKLRHMRSEQKPSELKLNRLLVLPVWAALSVALFFIYRAFPDALHNFDGVIFSAIITEKAINWRSEMFAYAGHFLFNPTGWLFNKAYVLVAQPRPGYMVVQTMNGLFAVCSAFAVFWMVRRITGRTAVAIPLALLFAHSHHFWTRAVECSVYAPSLFWIAAMFAALWRYHESGTGGSLLAAACSAGIAVLYHLAHAFWVPAVILLIWMKQRRDLPLFAGVFGIVAFLPQIITFRIFSPAAFHQWYLKQGSVATSAWGLDPGRLYWKPDLSYHASALFQTMWKWPPEDPHWGMLGLLLVAISLFITIVIFSARSVPRETLKADRPMFIFAGSFVACIVIFQTFWHKELTKYSPVIFAVVLCLAVLARGDFGRGKKFCAALWLLWACTFWYNGRAAIRPLSRLASNSELGKALFIGRYTEPKSVILMSGLAHPFLKVYTPLFAKRVRLSLDLYMVEYREKEKALSILRETQLDKIMAEGRPIYALEEIWESAFLKQAPAGWNLTQEDMRELFAGMTGIERARLAPDFRLYRLWPAKAPAKVWENYYLIAERGGQMSPAIYAARKLAEELPGPAGWKLLASAYSKMGKGPEAVSALEEALRRSPSDTWTLSNLARILYQVGERGRALQVLRRLPPDQARSLEEELKKSSDQ